MGSPNLGTASGCRGAGLGTPFAYKPMQAAAKGGAAKGELVFLLQSPPYL